MTPQKGCVAEGIGPRGGLHILPGTSEPGYLLSSCRRAGYRSAFVLPQVQCRVTGTTTKPRPTVNRGTCECTAEKKANLESSAGIRCRLQADPRVEIIDDPMEGGEVN